MKRREIGARLELFDDLAGVLNVMRSFALTELNRVGRRARAQLQLVEALDATYACLAPPPALPAVAGGDLWSLFGAARGYCGGFDEDVQQAWLAARGAAAPTPIVVGERLAARLAEAQRGIVLPAANGAAEAPAVIDRILAALAATPASPDTTTGLVACFRDENGARVQRVLPWPVPRAAAAATKPVLNEAPAVVAAGVLRHCVYHALLGVLLSSIQCENHLRLMQMERALSHLEKSMEQLRLRKNRLRQEEIIGEIEGMMWNDHDWAGA